MRKTVRSVLDWLAALLLRLRPYERFTEAQLKSFIDDKRHADFWKLVSDSAMSEKDVNYVIGYGWEKTDLSDDGVDDAH